MKTFILMMFISMNAIAADCLVDGISDSPQKYTCYIGHAAQVDKLSLSCQQGNYEIQWNGKQYGITVAYHEEVEEGSNPLVFVSEGLTLTTTSYQNYSRANLTVNGKNMDGLCFD